MNASMKWFSTLAIALSLCATAAAQDTTGAGAQTGGGDTYGTPDNGTPQTYGETSDTAPTTGIDVAPPTGTTLPLQLAARPLVNTRGTLTVLASPINPLMITGGFNSVHFGINSSVGSFSADTSHILAVGASYAPIDNLEVGAIVLPLQLSPTFKYGNPALYGVYRLLDGDFELGAGLAAYLPVQSGSDFALQLGVPMLYHLSPTMRLDTGVHLQMIFSDPMSNVLNIPVGLTVNVNDNIFLGARIGLNGTLKNFGDTVAIPLYLRAGYTLANNATGGPLADLVLQFGFPGFLSLGASEPVSTLQTAYWQLTVGGNFYLNM